MLELLRRLGAAMSQAQDNAERITQILDDVAKAYGAIGVSFFVLPTGLFVRIEHGLVQPRRLRPEQSGRRCGSTRSTSSTA